MIHFYKRCVSSLAWQVAHLRVRSGWVSVLFSHKPSLFRTNDSPVNIRSNNNDDHWQILHNEFGSKWVCRIFFPQSWVCPTRLKGILNLIQSYSQCFNGNIRVCLKHFVYKQIIRKFQGEKSLKFLMKIYFAKNLLIYPSYYQRIALNLINVI